MKNKDYIVFLMHKKTRRGAGLIPICATSPGHALTVANAMLRRRPYEAVAAESRFAYKRKVWSVAGDFFIEKAWPRWFARMAG